MKYLEQAREDADRILEKNNVINDLRPVIKALLIEAWLDGATRVYDNVDGTLSGVAEILKTTPAEDEEVAAKRARIKSLSHYVAEDAEEAYDKLMACPDDNVDADDVVMMWEPLVGRFTVGQLMEMI